MTHHNKLRDEVAELVGKYFTLTHVRDNLLIFIVCTVKSKKTQPTRFT